MSRPETLSKPALMLLTRVMDELTAREHAKPGVISFDAPDGVFLDDDFLERLHNDPRRGLLHIKLMTTGRTLVVEYMASLVHQRACRLIGNIWASLSTGRVAKQLDWNGRARQHLDRGNGRESRKEPDGSLQPGDRLASRMGDENANVPTLILEVGAFETDDDSRSYAQRWFSSPATEMIVNVVIVVSIRIHDGVFTVRTVTFVREHPQPQNNLRSRDVALVEPEALKHTWTDASSWLQDYVLPAPWFFDWDDSALGRQGHQCPGVHAATDVVISAADMNDWCERILRAHRSQPLQRP